VQRAVPSFLMTMERGGVAQMNGRHDTDPWLKQMNWPAAHRSATGGSPLIRHGFHQTEIVPAKTFQVVREHHVYVREMSTETAL
jgi:hypothetical protein